MPHAGKGTGVSQDTKWKLQNEVRKKIPFLVEFGDEQDIIEFAKRYNPQLTEAQLDKVVKLFLDAKRERGHSQQQR